jgi:hypothetical protein
MTVKKNMAASSARPGRSGELLAPEAPAVVSERAPHPPRRALGLETDVRTGALSTLVRERESYLKKVAVLKELKERILDIAKTRHSVSDGEFYKVAFDYHRDVTPVIERSRWAGRRDEARRRSTPKRSWARTSMGSRR